ncbi:MAG: hypothetical protein LCH70_00600 [Proteobacteria bacterium]|nr:hypothetical protein [Pseudomonadota bacterium]
MSPRAARRSGSLGIGGVLLPALLALSACSSDETPPASEIVGRGELVLSMQGEGDLRSAKPTPLSVPGRNWASRQVEWMLPEGSLVKKGELLARFRADEGKQQLDLALLDLQRNALSRLAKESELLAAQGRVDVDLAQVAVQLGIAQRYADADLSTLARNEVLDAIEDSKYLETRQDTLEWQRGQSTTRGGAELAVLDAQRATFDLNAQTRREDLDALELRAPNDGVLLLTANWSGDKPMIGTTLRAGQEFGSLPDTAAMEVQIDLPQIEAQGIKAGNAVELHPLGRPDQAFASTLSWVASAATVLDRESPVKYLSMRAAVPADAIAKYRFVPGQRFAAKIILLREPDALSVSNVAVEQQDGKHWVQVRDGRGFTRREVQLGVRGTARSQVVSGLDAGDEVLLSAGGVELPLKPADGDATPPGDATAAGESAP